MISTDDVVVTNIISYKWIAKVLASNAWLIHISRWLRLNAVWECGAIRNAVQCTFYWNICIMLKWRVPVRYCFCNAMPSALHHTVQFYQYAISICEKKPTHIIVIFTTRSISQINEHQLLVEMKCGKKIGHWFKPMKSSQFERKNCMLTVLRSIPRRNLLTLSIHWLILSCCVFFY